MFGPSGSVDGSSPVGKSFLPGKNFSQINLNAELPKDTTNILVKVSGSLNPTSELGNDGTPYTELQFDSFVLKQVEAKIELMPDGLLIFASPSSYIKLTRDGLEINGASITAESLTANTVTATGGLVSDGATSTASDPDAGTSGTSGTSGT